MTPEEFQTIFNYLVAEGIVVLPYGLVPGSRPGGIVEITTEEEWNAYGWNPPRYMQHLPTYRLPDPRATPKLSWAELLATLDAAMTDGLRPRLLVALQDETTRRISRAYGEDTFFGELTKRLREGPNQSSDAARDAIRTRYRTLKTLIKSMNYEDLKAFNVKADSNWSDLP